MVNLIQPSSSSPAASAIQQNSGLVSQQSEDGCNDDPPPIPSPPVGHAHSQPSVQPTGGVPFSPASHAICVDVSPIDRAVTRDSLANSRAGEVAGIKVYDYGLGSSPTSPPKSKALASATSLLSGGILFQRSDSSATTETQNSAATTPLRAVSRVSVASSVTAVDAATDTIAGFVCASDGSNAHAISVREVAAALQVDCNSGLPTDAARKRLETNGPNKLTSDGGIKWYTVLGRQVSNSLTLVLVIAMAASYGMLDFVEGSVIAAVICLNIVIGFVQDYRAEKTMQSLHSLSAPVATVVRDSGRIDKIKAEELVVGDIVKIRVGDVVPADLRVVDAVNLETNEALLTGESLPIAKNSDEVISDLNAPIGDRYNMLHASSTVTKGRGAGIVVATGMQTQVGRIAELLRGKKQVEGGPFRRAVASVKQSGKVLLGLVGTPLQVKLSKFALVLFGLAILLAIIVFSAAKWKINGEVLIYGICVAVAVIPESLIAVLTITMAVGTKSMARGNVIVRKMQALEAVGGVTNICSDKTGTLTQGKMVARKAYIPGLGEIRVDDVSGPFNPESGTVFFGDNEIDSSFCKKSEELEHFLEGIAICNLATVVRKGVNGTEALEKDDGWTATGEPTEISLQVLAMRFNKGKEELMNSGQWELLAEHPFDSTIKRMSVVYRHTGRKTTEAFMKGAGEVIVPTLNVSGSEKAEIVAMIERLAGEGLRVLCVAHKLVDGDVSDRNLVENGMNFLGLVGLYDPPRLETKDAVYRCKVAGVEVHMLTGDHIRTATAIAHEVGILEPAMPSIQANTMVMTATEFDALSDSEVDALEKLPKVIARCSPATKVRMVEALHRRKAFCVMTGDGVNDSPALKRADVGIAMGLSGSDVAKDAADLVLTDDNFASIVRAVEEGRRLFDNIQKFIMHLLISNISQVVLLLIGLAFQDRQGYSVFPLSPLEILWVNMITSSFLALGLGLEERSPDVMTRPPHDLRVGVFTWEVIFDKTLYGVTMGILCLIAFVIVIYAGNGGELGHGCNHAFNDSCTPVFKARATVFAVLSFLLLLTAWEVKHFTRSLFNLDPTRHRGPFAVFHALWYNRFLFWAVVAGFVITFPVIYIPVFNSVVFKHTAITWEWGIVVGACVAYLSVVEGWKAIKRWRGIGSAGRKSATLIGTDLEAGSIMQASVSEEGEKY